MGDPIQCQRAAPRPLASFTLSDQDRAAIAGFAAVLADGTFELPANEVRTLALAAVEYAKDRAQTDPILGSGRDLRAIYALTEGLVLGALAWRQAAENADASRQAAENADASR